MLSNLARRTVSLAQRRVLPTLLHAPTPTQTPRYRLSSTKAPSESNLHRSNVQAKGDDKDVPMIPSGVIDLTEARINAVRLRNGVKFERPSSREYLTINPAAASSRSTIPNEAPQSGIAATQAAQQLPIEPLKKRD